MKVARASVYARSSRVPYAWLLVLAVALTLATATLQAYRAVGIQFTGCAWARHSVAYVCGWTW